MSVQAMFDPSVIDEHIGPDLQYQPRLYDLSPVETYFIEKCKELGINYSYDCTADESTFWKTLNYTTYAGMFIMHPLCFSATLFQSYDAKADNCNSAGHINWIKQNIEDGLCSKYTLQDNQILEDYSAIAVIPGHNKFAQHWEKIKFNRIVNKHGSQLLLKPHPISNDSLLDFITKQKGDCQIASNNDDLYNLMVKADLVYTTHVSETALTALIMGKKISPMDPFGMRMRGAFTHINHFCFSEPDPITTVSQIMASPKSGIICPEVDIDWKAKIDEYFNYAVKMRTLQRGHYCGK